MKDESHSPLLLRRFKVIESAMFLGGNGTKLALTGDIFGHTLVKCVDFGPSLPTP